MFKMKYLVYLVITVFLGGCDDDDNTNSTTSAPVPDITFNGDYSMISLQGPGSVEITAGDSTSLGLYYPESSIKNVGFELANKTLTITNACNSSACQSASGNMAFQLKGTFASSFLKEVNASHYVDLKIMFNGTNQMVDEFTVTLSNGSRVVAGSKIMGKNSVNVSTLSGGSVVGGVELVSPNLMLMMNDTVNGEHFGSKLSPVKTPTAEKTVFMLNHAQNVTMAVTNAGHLNVSVWDGLNWNMYADNATGVSGYISAPNAAKTYFNDSCPVPFTNWKETITEKQNGTIFASGVIEVGYCYSGGRMLYV